MLTEGVCRCLGPPFLLHGFALWERQHRVGEWPWLRPCRKCWARALSSQGNAEAEDLRHRLCLFGRRGNDAATPPIAPPRAVFLPLTTFIFSKAPWLQQVLKPLHINLGWCPHPLCCSCTDKQAAAPGHVNTSLRLLSVCCYWSVLEQARGALR